MVLPSHRRGIIATRIILVIQTMDVRRTKLTYQVALSIVILNLMLQIQRVESKALKPYIIAAWMTNTDHVPAVGVITTVMQITHPTTMVKNEIIDPIGIDTGAMIIVHRGDKQNLQWFLRDPETTLPLYTEEQLDLPMMRNSIMRNIMKQTFCFITVLTY